jgi:DNA-binding NarL/FixJ family response regulator
MPRLDGIAAARRILADSRLAIRVIMLTTFDSDEYLYAALDAGACGFLLKSTPRAHLLHAVRTAAHGEALLDPVLTRRIVEEHAARRPWELSDRLRVLTGRELDVLRQLAYGRSNAEIAAALNLAETTVKTHVAAVLRKLDLRGRVQAVILGYETGLVRPGAMPPKVDGSASSDNERRNQP